MKRQRTRYTYTSPWTTREFLFFFGKNGGSWCSIISGFTHVYLAEFIDESKQKLIVFDPLFTGGYMYPTDIDEVAKLHNDEKNLVSYETVLRVKVQPTSGNRLLKPTLQTCATLVQYMAAISLGSITCQGLYECLINDDHDWLLKKGILEVKPWEGIVR